jgi:peptide/nickel transport system substrate-binding protein
VRKARAKVGEITPDGFRDVLEMGRGDREDLYNYHLIIDNVKKETKMAGNKNNVRPTFVPPKAATTPPRYGGVLKLRIPDPVIDVPIGEPLNSGGADERYWVCLEGLLGPGEKLGTYKCVLATGYTLAPDKSYYDITLRQGVKFHDNTPFNAEAVKWNLDRVLAAHVALPGVDSIDVVDDYTVRLKLSRWTNLVLADLAVRSNTLMISPTAYKKNGKDWVLFHPVGTAAFIFKEIKNDKIIITERNPNYWGNDAQGNRLPYLDGVEMHYIHDLKDAQTALEKGETNMNHMMDGKVAIDLEGSPDYYIIPTWGGSTLALYAHSEDPKCMWYDSRMRQALEYALDKDTVTLSTPYRPASYHAIGGLEYAPQEAFPAPRKYDPAKAKELKAAAGYPGDVTFDWYAGALFMPELGHVILAYQQQMVEAGFKANLQVLSLAKWNELQRDPLPGNAINLGVEHQDRIQPLVPIAVCFSEASLMFKGVQKPAAFKSCFDKLLVAEDVKEQIALIKDMDRVATEDAMIVPIDSGFSLSIVSQRVHDARVDMSEGFWQARSIWLSE